MVIVPIGSATWSTTVSVTKGITLVGGNNTGGVTTITQGGGANTVILSVNAPNKSVTVENFTFVESYADNPTSGFIEWQCNPNSFWRCCSNIFNCVGGMTVFGSDVGTGLIDNNNFTFDQNDCVSIFGTGDGTSAWNYGTTYGTTNYVFFEHNTVSSINTSIYQPDGVIDCYGGAKFVFRYNIITNADWGWHGCDSGGYRSTHSYEIYMNQVYFNGANPPYWNDVFNSRGGTGLVWSNTIVGWLAGSQGHSAFLMQYYREDASYAPYGQFPDQYDGNIAGQSPTGYQGLDQQGWTGPTHFYSTYSTQVQSPTYIWGNTGLSVGASDSVIQQNRDYYLTAPPFSYAPLAYPYPLGGTQSSTTNPPQITSQPVNTWVVAGQTAAFNVTASGSGTLTYQWSWYGTNVIGATSSSWTTPATLIGYSNSVVYVKVSNAYGSATSSNAYLFVTNGVAPSITANPTSQTNTAGGSITFSVTAGGTAPLAYQWFFNSGAIANATNSSYTIAPVGINNGGIYTVVVTNSYGSATSLAAILTVTASTQTVHYYYVAPNGNDSTGNGSISSPWATVDHATSVMNGGDVLYIRGGTYSQIFDIYGPSGSAGYPTTVEAYPGETPVFNANNIGGSAHSLDGLNWFVIGGLTIMSNNIGMIVGYAGACTNVVLTNMTFADIGQQGFQIEHNSYNILVVNSTVHDTGLWTYNGEGMYIGEGDSSGILDNAHNITIQGCTVYNTKDEGIELKGGTYNVTVQGNVLYSDNLAQDSYGAGGGAIEVDEEGTYNYWPSNPNQVVAGNLVYNTYIGIRAATGGQYYNNIVYNVTNNGILINNTGGQSANANYTRYVYNNTVDVPQSIAIVNSGVPASILNNIGPAGAYNLATSSSYYLNGLLHRYHLVAGSAPIGAGTNLFNVVPTDFDGSARPNTGPFDIGAYEYPTNGGMEPPPGFHQQSP